MKPGENGMAMMIALWAIILMGAFVGGMLTIRGGDAALTANRIDAARARHLAEAGVQRAIAALADPAAREKIPMGQPFSIQLNDEATISVQVKDSCGAIDLNWAPLALLRAYAETAGMKPAAAERFASAIVARQQSVLSQDAVQLNTGPWQSLDQLADLPDMDRGLLQALRPGLTINCREVGADACCAPEAVKHALSLAGVNSSPSHKLAYEIAAQASLASGAKVTVQAAIWLSREAGPPFYFVTGWRTQ
ncbi:MAG: hypothetical protein ABL951_00500 [Alphaproteobacteria bacterium]